MRFNFPEVMKKLSNDELMEYLKDSSKYMPEAVKAAIDELKRRNISIPIESILSVQTRIEAQTKTHGIVYASFISRAGANIIDVLIMIPLSIIMVVLIRSVGIWIVYPLQILISLISSAYIIFFLARYGATLGKMICKIEVRKLDYSPIGWPEALKRHSVELSASLILGLLSFAALLSIPYRQMITISPEDLEPLINSHRSPLYSIVALLDFLWGIGELVSLFFNKRRRALHDYLGGTVVVEKSSLKNINEISAFQETH